MARQSFFQSMANMFLRQAIRETRKAIKSSSSRASQQRSRSAPAKPKRDGMTQYLVSGETIPMGHGGMRSYPVSGESFYFDHFEKLYALNEGQDEFFTDAYLVPEPNNPVDKYAVAVVIDKYVVGHLPKHSAKSFSDFLDGQIGKCSARVYMDLDYGRNSVELDLDYPPRDTSKSKESKAKRDLVGSEAPTFDMTQVSTSNASISFVKLAPGEVHEGVAIVLAGFSGEPEIIDSETLSFLGSPYQTISWDFNVFARSMGGEFRVRYRLELNERGNFKLSLDSSGLPKFKRSRY